jgi:hypothetical protein
MIGFDSGGGGGGYGIDVETVQDAWARLTELWDTVFDLVTDVVSDVANAIYEWVATVVDIYRWVTTWVSELYGVTMERWVTAGDERTCPQCGGMNGQIREKGEGEYPPLHGNCRCGRVFAFTEWHTREVLTTVREHTQETVWTWQLTGWA